MAEAPVERRMALSSRAARVETTLRHTARACNGSAAMVGIAGLVGWLADLPALRTFGSAFPSMPVASAVAVLLMAAALDLLQRGTPRAARFGTVAAVVVAALALLGVTVHTIGPTIASYIEAAPSSALREALRPLSWGTVCGLVGIAGGVVLYRLSGPLVIRAVRFLATAVLAIALVSIVGLSYRVLMFYSAAPLFGTSLPTAIALVLLGASLLAGRPDPWVVRVLAEQQPGAITLRWLLPTALVAPLFAGWVTMGAERVGLIDEPAGAGLITLLMTIVLWTLGLTIARQLDGIDARRAQAEDAMRDAYAQLDRRVSERTAELERATAALRERTRLLVAVTASTRDLLCARDLDGRILLANPAWLRAAGIAEADALGRRVAEFAADAAQAERDAADDRRVIESERPSVVEQVAGDGADARTFLITKSPLVDEHGSVVGLLSVAADISERKRAERDLEALLAGEQRLREQAEGANRAKDEFLAIVSHELRSPLNALQGWSHLLARTRPLDPAMVERATAAIARSVQHQARLIDDLLDTARIMSGKLTLERRPLDLAEVVRTALEMMRPAAAAKHVELRAVYAPVLASVEGDAGRLQQVLTNLLSNAIKFTPENGRVEVALTAAAGRVALTVRDSGVGIPADFLPRVFERFSQADTSSSRRTGGLGIGLALVRNLVELHGGTVRAESGGEGAGAVFTVDLPLAAAAGSVVPASALPAEPRAPAHSLANRRVYVLDDDPDARETIALTLRAAAATVETFPSGAALLERLGSLAADWPDVVLLDLAMPGEDGFGVLRRLRALEAERRPAGARPIPAIAVTAFIETDRGQLAAAGFQDLVGKPVNTERLLRAIGATLDAAPPAAPRAAAAPEARRM